MIVLTKKMRIRSQNPNGMSDSSIALALSVKKIIWTADNTHIKKTAIGATFCPEIIITGIASSAFVTKTAGAISTAFGI
ncbi:MAG: hypothetical protein AB1420_03315 [Bacillota bacterium]